MRRIIKIGLIIAISCVASSIYAADENKANQYTNCASSALTTGLIKTAFNQRSDYESQSLVYGGLGMALYAGYLSSPEYALNTYRQHQQKIKQDSLKYISSGSRNEIYKFTVSYLVPKNENCAPLIKELAVISKKKDAKWDKFRDSLEAKQLMEGVMESAKELIVGKTIK